MQSAAVAQLVITFPLRAEGLVLKSKPRQNSLNITSSIHDKPNPCFHGYHLGFGIREKAKF